MTRGPADVEREKRVKITRTDNGAETVIALEGSLKAETVKEMQDISVTLAREGRKSITLDCSGLDLIDSQGVAAIVGLNKRVRTAGGTLKVAGLRDQPRAIFKLLRFDRIFDL